MEFKVGDKVIHWVYGLGEVIQLDEKVLSGKKTPCYVVQIRDLTIWVPANEDGKRRLRLPTPGNEFDRLFAILGSPSEPLSSDRIERRTQLLEKMEDGKLESICRIVRDLSKYRQGKKLNDYEKSILERAQEFLLVEWKYSLFVPRAQAERELKHLLGEQAS
jgi:RNA polymerase-interacting CarD/CdnL/TRCF family regulator